MSPRPRRCCGCRWSALVLALVNAALGVVLHPREKLLARLLWIGGAVVLGIVFVAVVRLLQ